MDNAKNKKVVIFDFDGTVVDSMDAFADIASRVMPKHFPVDEKTARKMYLETSGIPFFEQLEVLFPENHRNEKAATEFEETKKKDYLSKKAFTDASKTIAKLRENGVRVVVSSNNFQDLVDKLVDNLNIDFDMVLGFKPGFAKGEEHFAHVEKALGVSRSDMVFVGDSIKDGERAQNSGVDFIAKEGTFAKTEFKKSFPKAKVISSLKELNELL